MEYKGATAIIGAACMMLTILMIVSPFLYAPGSMTGLEGTPGIMDRGWSLSDLPYCLGDLFCHQDTSRSFIVNENQLPVCIRDIGILSGLSVGLILSFLSGWSPSTARGFVAVLLLCSVTVVEWCLETTMDLPDAVRCLSGIVSGIGAGFLGAWMIRRVYENG